MGDSPFLSCVVQMVPSCQQQQPFGEVASATIWETVSCADDALLLSHANRPGCAPEVFVIGRTKAAYKGMRLNLG